jgi:predicted TIM-barrel fold metal-dependent hydrolase
MTDVEPPKLIPPGRDGRVPRLKAPPGACDTHFHIYEADIPLKPGRRYTPVDAGLGHYRATMTKLGLARGVVVTGSAMIDNEPSLRAIAAMDGAFKGLALVKADIADAELERLAAGGMTGFRISTRSVGGMAPAHLMRMADRVKDLGWHVEVHLNTADEVVELLPVLARLSIPHTLDHVANLGPAYPPGSPAFDVVVRHLRDCEDAWLNTYSVYNLSRTGAPDFVDMVENVATLIAARPDRIIWGLNWPHPTFDVDVPDDADVLDFLLSVVPDPAVRKAILADNPARLYGFDPV